MATTSVTVIASTALDIAGISTATSAPDGADPRKGSIFNPNQLAAAQPVWFHPLKTGSHLMVSRRTWTQATPSGGTPGIYSAFTDSTVPSWVIINGSAGSTTPMPGGPAIPMNAVVDTDSAVITGAVSRPSENMWLLYSAQINEDPAAVLQRWAVASNGAVTLGGEEVLPSTATVVFDKGIQYATPYLYVYGTDTTGALHRIRKGWSRTGFNKVRVGQIGAQPGQVWEYYTGSGWSQDPGELGPMQEGVGSVGPVSFGYVGDQVIMSTVEAQITDDGLLMVSTDADTIADQDMVDRVGKIWTSNTGRPWSPANTAVALGATDDDTHLGGGLVLLSQLGANPTALAGTNNAGIVYVTSQKVTDDTDFSLVNQWGIYPVVLVG